MKEVVRKSVQIAVVLLLSLTAYGQGYTVNGARIDTLNVKYITVHISNSSNTGMSMQSIMTGGVYLDYGQAEYKWKEMLLRDPAGNPVVASLTRMLNVFDKAGYDVLFCTQDRAVLRKRPK